MLFFPGSTLGNLHPTEAERFLHQVKNVIGPLGGFLIGLDLKKDPDTLHHAYDDQEGVTAEFNKNLLYRMNRELGANFNPNQFSHRAFYNEPLGRIEMHLVSDLKQVVHIAGIPFTLQKGESIHTESSYKYTRSEFIHMAERSGFHLVQLWTDPKEYFCVFYFEN